MTPSLTSRARESLKYRLFFSWCRLLEKHKSSRTAIPHVPYEAELPRIITLCGSREIPYLTASLASLALSHGALPSVTVYADSRSTYKALEKTPALASHAPAISLREWDSDMATLPEAHVLFIRSVLQHGRQPVLVKKLAVLLGSNLQGQTFFVDSDVLWREPLLNNFGNGGTAAKMGLDWQRAYDASLEAAVDPHGLLKSHPPLNSGFIYFSPGTLQEVLTESLFSSLVPHAPSFGWHGEQTLVAFAFLKLGGTLFTRQELATTAEDNFRIRSTVRSAARHYAGCKHLFWRDFKS